MYDSIKSVVLSVFVLVLLTVTTLSQPCLAKLSKLIFVPLRSFGSSLILFGSNFSFSRMRRCS